MPKQPPPPTNSNPYRKAAQNYATQSGRQENARDTEAKALLRAAKKMQDLQSGWVNSNQQKIEETLKYNRQIWVTFYDNAINKNSALTSSDPVSTNVIKLASFVFKRSVEILAAPDADKFSMLININREIAAGLMSRKDSSK